MQTFQEYFNEVVGSKGYEKFKSELSDADASFNFSDFEDRIRLAFDNRVISGTEWDELDAMMIRKMSKLKV
jgi:hypothetical protein